MSDGGVGWTDGRAMMRFSIGAGEIYDLSGAAAAQERGDTTTLRAAADSSSDEGLGPWGLGGSEGIAGAGTTRCYVLRLPVMMRTKHAARALVRLRMGAVDFGVLTCVWLELGRVGAE